MLSGITDDQIPENDRRPGHRRPDQLVIRSAGDAGGRSYEELYVEHAPVAQRIALSMVPRDVADDIVAEAFARVLGAIRAGGGPGIAFRAYLLTAVRNTANDWLRASRRTTAIGDVEQDLEERVPEENMGVARLSRAPKPKPKPGPRLVWSPRPSVTCRRAGGPCCGSWRSRARRPPRSRRCSGCPPTGCRPWPSGRARASGRPTCKSTSAGISRRPAARTRKLSERTPPAGLPRRRTAVHEHLEQCTGCYALANELTEINSRLGAILTPAALAGAAAALASGGHGTLSVQAGAGLKGSLIARGGPRSRAGPGSRAGRRTKAAGPG